MLITLLIIPVLLAAFYYSRWVYLSATLLVILTREFLIIFYPNDVPVPIINFLIWAVSIVFVLESVRYMLDQQQVVEEKLLKSERMYRSLINASPDGIFITDIKGFILFASDRAVELFGYATPDELLHMNLRRLLKTDKNTQTAFQSNQQSISVFGLGKNKAYRKDGSTFDIECNADIFTPSEGSDPHVIYIARDISERIRITEERHKAVKAAESANYARSQFLATVSHEIRSPMNGVIGMTNLLLNTELSDEQMEYVGVIRTSGDTLLALVNDILDFSKIEANKIEFENKSFDVRDCVESSLDLLASRATEKGLSLEYYMAPSTPETVMGDAHRLRQILINLLTNSIKFTQAGEVLIHVDAEKTDPYDKVSTLHFAVRDTGIGIPKDKQDKLFESFSQVGTETTRKYGGTGLGLSISKQLTEMMGGTIWVESIVDKGSTFHFSIPAEVVPASHPRFDSEKLEPLAGKHMLITDDNATNRLILGRYAESWEMSTSNTASGAEALALVQSAKQEKDNSKPFDIAILDMQMPEMDGIMLAQRIQAIDKKIPLILLTSWGQSVSDLPEGLFTKTLYKPIKPDQLFNVIQLALTQKPAVEVVDQLSIKGIDANLAEEQPLRVLIAEDEAINQKVIHQLLSKMGYQAEIANNGLEAIKALEKQPYDVILMDVRMPEMDGLEATRHIRTDIPSTLQPHIIALTGDAVDGQREKYLAAGMDDYLTKPIQTDMLELALRNSHATGGLNPAIIVNDTIQVKIGDQPAKVDPLTAIDHRALKRYWRGINNANEELENLTMVFVSETPGQLSKLREALAAGNTSILSNVSRTLKRASLPLGAVKFSSLSSKFERAARTRSMKDLGNLLAGMEAEFNKIVPELTLVVSQTNRVRVKPSGSDRPSKRTPA